MRRARLEVIVSGHARRSVNRPHRSEILVKHLTTSVFLLVAAVGCSSPSPVPEVEPTPAPASSLPTHEAKVTLVDDPSLVCMVNNQFMGQPQIPIEVDGTTYFGCCEMCKTKLATDPSSRTAIDPVSGASVDKAKAVLGKSQTGAIHYFESAENLASYARGT
jgi:YHS domain-containing protein